MESALIDETSARFLGKWKRLVSTTNWEKGRILSQWRQALLESGAASSEYSDDAWSQRVGGISPQHVGRLRRVFERFGQVKDTYAGLYWSHFQAAAEWDDAELWLEGAVQNGWSISQMRRQRWETLGSLETPPADNGASALDEWDTDADADVFDEPADHPEHVPSADDYPAETTDRRRRDEAAGDDSADENPRPSRGNELAGDAPSGTAAQPVRPFAHLPKLPDDVSEAFEAFKLSILRHKLSGWEEISRDDLLATLDALKELAIAG